MSSTGKVLLGVLAGAAAGAILGILLAPDKGSKTRKMIAEKGGEYADTLKDKYDEFVTGMTETVEETKKDARSFVQNGKAKVDEFKKDAKSTIG